jgi:hypothetical protein
MEQRASGGSNSSQVSLEIPHILWTPIFHYRVHKYPPLVCILSQINLFYLLNIYFKIIFLSTPRSSKYFLSISFFHQNLVCTTSLLPAYHVHCPSHFSRLDRPNNMWWAVQITKLPSMQFSPFPCYRVPPRLFLTTLLSNTLSLCLSLHARYQIWCQWKQHQKLYLCFYYFLHFWTASCKTEDSGPKGSLHSLRSDRSFFF